MSGFQIDLLFAIGLPLVGVIQAIFLWVDARAGKVRISPMHYISKTESPRGYAIALGVNILLIAFVLLVGAYYIASVI